VGENLIYKQFGSKPALFEAAVIEPLRAALDDFTERWSRAGAEPGTGEFTAREYVEALYDLLEGHAEPLLAIMADRRGERPLVPLFRELSGWRRLCWTVRAGPAWTSPCWPACTSAWSRSTPRSVSGSTRTGWKRRAGSGWSTRQPRSWFMAPPTAPSLDRARALSEPLTVTGHLYLLIDRAIALSMSEGPGERVGSRAMGSAARGQPARTALAGATSARPCPDCSPR